MNALRAAAGVAGVAVLAATVALVFGVVAPAESLSAVTDSLDDGQYLLVLAGTLILAGLWFARRRGSSTTERFIELRESPPEGVAAPASIRVGGQFDRLVGDSVADEDEDAMAPVAAELRATATGLYADETGVDPGTARGYVRDGAWTDDRLAASFVGEERPPLRSRIRVWLDPARERRRRLDATLDALFELREGVVPAVSDAQGPADAPTASEPESPASAGEAASEGRVENPHSDADDTGGEDADADDADDDDAGEENRSWVARVTDGGRRR